jgi:hypothetical protein
MSFTTRGELDEVKHEYQTTIGQIRPRKMMYKTIFRYKKYLSIYSQSIRRAWCSCDYRSSL